MKASRFLMLSVVAALGGCGNVADLKPAAGQSLPVKPLMARTQPTAKDLLARPTYARPDRVDELEKRSQPRPNDPFDLPPPTGGSAPTQPAGTEPAPVTNDTSVEHPGD